MRQHTTPHETIPHSNEGEASMQRTTLLLMIVSTLAILSASNIKTGFAQTDNDCLLLEISGASGRSVCEDTTFEGWRWTAPATGPVTFNTQGSDMTLRLTVHTFDPVYTEVAAAPDVVRFTAQEGTVYSIFASADDEAEAGTIVLNWRAGSSCGDGGASLVGSSGETGLREAVFDDPDPGAPAYVLAGPNASIWYWMTDDTVTQSLYVSTDGSVSVRTFHDVDGLPHKVLNECSGDWILIQRYDAENVDFWFYDADGNYQSGFAVFEDEGSYYYAEIDGVPVHAGKQITGSLRPTWASWTGSYTLEVSMSEIQDWQPVPDEIAELINGLSSDGEGRRGMVIGWRTHLATVLGPLGAWLLPGVAVAQPAVTVQDVLFWGGITMVGVGTAGLAAPVYATAGAVTFFASFLAPHVSQETIRSRCPDSPKMAHDLCHMIADNLADPGERGPIGFFRNLRERLRGGAKQLLSGIGRFLNPPNPPQTRTEPIYLIPDDNPPETVSGTMTDGTTAVDVTGTVTSDGDFDVADEYGAVQLQLSVNADDKPVEGSFEWNGVSGEVEVDTLPDDEVEVDTTQAAEDLTDLEAELEEAMRKAEEARRLAEQAARELDGAIGAIDGSTAGRPILIKPLPDLKGPVGSGRTIDLSQHFESTDDGRLTYGTTSNEDPDVASARVSGSTLTLQARQAGTTTIRVTAWHFTSGTSIADTMQVQVTGPSDDDDVGTPARPSGSSQVEGTLPVHCTEDVSSWGGYIDQEKAKELGTYKCLYWIAEGNHLESWCRIKSFLVKPPGFANPPQTIAEAEVYWAERLGNPSAEWRKIYPCHAAAQPPHQDAEWPCEPCN